MRTVFLIAAAVALAAGSAKSQAAETAIEARFGELTELVETLGDLPVNYVSCPHDAWCEGEVGSDILQMMWPETGGLTVSLLPSTDSLERNLTLCAVIFEFATGAGPEVAGAIAGTLAGQAEMAGQAEQSVGRAELKATKTSGGMIECETWTAARRP